MKDYVFTNVLIDNYQKKHRDLPWRRTKNPYNIWLSEIILQQTRVVQGLPYYEKFIQKYPTVFELAAAEIKEVLKIWEGLGYYSRARNMHETARYIVHELGGEFPSDYKNLLKLKGVGEYTAAAIASIAFQEDIAVLDGNVYRVLARYYGLKEDISSHEGKKQFKKIAQENLDTQQPGIYNQAIMEYGATVCLPKNPDCGNCQLSDVCYAYRNSEQQILPVNLKKVKTKKRFFHYLIFYNENRIAFKKRTQKDIWNGLYDFYLLEVDESDWKEKKTEHDIRQLYSGSIVELSDPRKHKLTHQEINLFFWHIHLNDRDVLPGSDNEAIRFFTYEKATELPKPIIIANYFEKNFI